MKKIILGLTLLGSMATYANECRDNLKGAYECFTVASETTAFIQIIKNVGESRISISENNKNPSVYNIGDSSNSAVSVSCNGESELEISRKVDNSRTNRPYYVKLNDNRFKIGTIQNITSRYMKVSKDQLQVEVDFDGKTAGLFTCDKL